MNGKRARTLLSILLGSAALVWGTTYFSDSSSAAASAVAVVAPAASPVASTGAGIIRGHIAFTGKHPGNPLIRMGMDPKCAEMNAGKHIFQDRVLMKPDNSLADVFVELEGSFPATPVPKEPVVIDQRGCLYHPRVVGMRVGQTLRVRNDDNLLHNVHSSSEHGNSFNMGQPVAGIFLDYKPKSDEMMLRIGCDVHRWMTAFVGIVSHPYFAVSAADGTFEIRGVPPGTYELETWQEVLGKLEQRVTVKAGGVATIKLVYPPSAVK